MSESDWSDAISSLAKDAPDEWLKDLTAVLAALNSRLGSIEDALRERGLLEDQDD